MGDDASQWHVRRRRRLLAAALIAALLLAGCGGGHGGSTGTQPTTTPSASGSTTAAQSGTVRTGTLAPAAREWSAPNADTANTRRIDSPIDTATVDRLHLAWQMPLQAAYAATPVVSHGTVYTQDLESNVSAIDLRSGRLRWHKDYGESDTGPNGVNVVGDRVYGATATRAFALNARTGAELWTTTVAREPGDLVDMAPGYDDGTVYVSTAVAGLGAVGRLWALNAGDGRPRWTWRQVPADLWGRAELNAGGGLWHPPAFDGRGFIYVSTANPLPFPGTHDDPWGSSRPGANRWTNSIVKLKASNGAFVWGRQVLPHDIYDWDLEGPVMLAKAAGRLIAITAGKMGYVYAFDAATGAMRWKRSVGLHNGHDHDAALVLHGDAAELRSTAKVLPGWWGGVESQMAFDGRTVYVPVNNLYTVYSGTGEIRPQTTTAGTGEVVALDVATGRVRWDRRLPHSVYGAATVSNDLVFTTTYEGVVWALDTRSGRVAWRARLPAGSISPVAISGDTLIAAGSVAVSGDQQPAIVAYRLR